MLTMQMRWGRGAAGAAAPPGWAVAMAGAKPTAAPTVARAARRVTNRFTVRDSSEVRATGRRPTFRSVGPESLVWDGDLPDLGRPVNAKVAGRRSRRCNAASGWGVSRG